MSYLIDINGSYSRIEEEDSTKVLYVINTPIEQVTYFLGYLAAGKSQFTLLRAHPECFRKQCVRPQPRCMTMSNSVHQNFFKPQRSRHSTQLPPHCYRTAHDVARKFSLFHGSRGLPQALRLTKLRERLFRSRYRPPISLRNAQLQQSHTAVQVARLLIGIGNNHTDSRNSIRRTEPGCIA